MFPLMLYNGPSGLNLYIFTSTLFGIIESKVIRRHIKEREEAEKAGRVIVDAKPTRQGKQLSRNDEPQEPQKGGLWASGRDLQAKAEQVRQEQDRRRQGRETVSSNGVGSGAGSGPKDPAMIAKSEPRWVRIGGSMQPQQYRFSILSRSRSR